MSLLLFWPTPPSIPPVVVGPIVEVYLSYVSGGVTVNEQIGVRNGTMIIQETANGRNTLTFMLDSVQTTTRPTVGNEISVFEDGVRIFGGLVTEPEEVSTTDRIGNDRSTSVRAEDFNSLPTRRFVTGVFPGGTLKAALQFLMPYFSPYGIFLDPAQVDGPTTIPAITYEDKRGDEALTDLTTMSAGYLWNVDYSKRLAMKLPSVVPAPFSVTDTNGNAIGDITLSPVQTDFANRIIVRAGNGVHAVTDDFIADGVTSSFTLSVPFVSNPAGYVYRDYINNIVESFAIAGQGFDLAAFWLYYAVDNTIRRVPGAGPPPVGSRIRINYQAQYPIRVISDGGAAPSDVVERVIDEPEVFDKTQAQSLADGYRTRFNQSWRNVKYTTLGTGLHPGQLQRITKSARNLDADCLITDVTVRHLDGKVWVREVSASVGSGFFGSWRDTLKQWNSGGASFGGGGGVNVTIVNTNQGIGVSGTIVTNSLAKWTGGQSIGSSILNESGSTITLAGTLAATTLQGNLAASFLTAGDINVSLTPAITSTYDLGTSTKLWRQAYISQINAVLFAKEVQSLYGGWLSVNKSAGTFPTAIGSADTTIDFGQSMVPNQFVLIRANDAANSITEEYIKVLVHAGGTSYNVTRDLSGIGAKNWTKGTPFAVRGVSGDGWVELNAYDTPRMSVFTQGSNYNNSVENIRIGHLTGMPNASSGIGAYMGDATNYFRWDGTALTLISAGCTIDLSGITLGTPTAFTSSSAMKFNRVTTGGFGQSGDVNSLHAEAQAGSPYTTFIAVENTIKGTGVGVGGANGDARVSLIATGWNNASSGSSRTQASIYVESGSAGSICSISATNTLLSGVLVIAGQLSFPATQNPSSNVNTLDDYEEGTWTPILVSDGGAGVPTYSNQTGNYIKIGQAIHCWGRIVITSKNSLPAGNLLIGGLPFTVNGTYNHYSGMFPYWQGTANFYATVTAYVALSTTTAVLQHTTGTVSNGTANFLVADANDAFDLMFDLSFPTSA